MKRRNKIQLQKIINESGNQKHFHNIDKFKKGEIVKSLGKVFDSAGKVEAPDESQIQTTLWLPEAMSFPAIDPDNANTDSLDENVADYEEDDLEAVA